MTQDQFEALAAANRELRLERTASGELIVNPPTGWETGKRNFSLIVELGIWRKQQAEPGEGFESSTGFTLPNGAIRSPDLSWVSKARWNSLSDEQKKTFAGVCPNFVVELRSSSDALKKLRDKMQEYMGNGAQLGWLIDPQDKQVEVYRQGQQPEILEAPTDLSGEDVLPRFILELRSIWM